MTEPSTSPYDTNTQAPYAPNGHPSEAETSRSPTLETKRSGPIVYYDGSCPLCTAEINHYKAQKGSAAITFHDVSDPRAVIGEDLTREDAMGRFHVRKANGDLASGARGFIEIWRTLPRWRWAAKLASLPGVPLLLEGAYRVFLPIRPLLSKVAGKIGLGTSEQCPKR